MRSRQSRSSDTAVISRAASLRAAAVALKRFSSPTLRTPFAQMTCDPVRRRRLFEQRFLDPAPIESIGATGVETAARGKLDRARHIAGKNEMLSLDGRVRHRNCRKQRLGIRVQRIAEQRTLRCELEDPAKINHSYPVADVFDLGALVRDVKLRQANIAMHTDQ